MKERISGVVGKEMKRSRNLFSIFSSSLLFLLNLPSFSPYFLLHSFFFSIFLPFLHIFFFTPFSSQSSFLFSIFSSSLLFLLNLPSFSPYFLLHSFFFSIFLLHFFLFSILPDSFLPVSKPAVLRNVPSSENTDVQIVRMPIAFPNPLSNRHTEESEYDSATSAALSRYKYYKHLEKYSASNNGKPAAEPVLVMPDHMLPSRFLTILTFPKKITGKQKSIITIFALWNTMMGTALLSMPWAIRKAGFANGVTLLILIAFLMFYSAYRIMSCTLEMAHLGLKDFSDVCRHYLGQAGYIMCSICSLISLIGGMIVYWILLSNFMYNTVKYFFLQSNDQFKNSTHNSSVEVLCPDRDGKNLTLDDNLPLNDIWAVIARLFIFLQLGAIFPLLIYVFRIQLLHVTFKVIWPGLHIVILLNLFICGLCIVFACFLPYIGKVIGYVGAFCGFSYALALPLSVYLLSSYEKGTLTGPIFTIHVLLMMLGLANFIAQFFV
ncbi:SLC38A9 [Acanthosepion pharaonis]|uniref:SLC38A9 n=1 Tax=Acanthosepion pharaonis TaxID=158019 RepID=A0A812EB86_ACAPH|nr:SLC38A9 [Sepia pharaonis]